MVRQLIERRVDGLILAAPQLEGDPEAAVCFASMSRR